MKGSHRCPFSGGKWDSALTYPHKRENLTKCPLDEEVNVLEWSEWSGGSGYQKGEKRDQRLRTEIDCLWDIICSCLCSLCHIGVIFSFSVFLIGVIAFFSNMQHCFRLL